MVKMNRTFVLDTLKKVGQKVTIFGRVQTVRDHGKVTFLDIFDETGIVQAVTRTFSIFQKSQKFISIPAVLVLFLSVKF